MKPIDQILKKTGSATPPETSPATSGADRAPTERAPTERAQTDSRPFGDQGNLGDPNCPVCGGIGFVRRDLPVGHPEFGQVEICSCRQGEVLRSAHRALIHLSNLEAFTDMTFDTFKVQGRLGLGDQQVNSLQNAYNQSLLFAQELKGWLLLVGGFGVGKTHLAASIGRYAVEHGVKTLLLTVPDLLDWLRFAYSSPESSFEERFDEIRNIRLLVLDDLGTQNATPWAQEKLFQILNYRYLNHLPTVLTTNQRLEEIDGRIRSRLSEPELVTLVKIEAPDYRDSMHDSSQPSISSLEHHVGQTFGNFNLRETEKITREQQTSLERAYKAAQRYAEDPHGWIVFTGQTFCGKTHLAAAIGNFRAALGHRVLFVEAPNLLDHLRSTFSPSSSTTFDEIFDEVRYAPLLVIDDLGSQSATPWAREKLFQILNYRYQAEMPTVITTLLPIDEFEPRIASRMKDERRCRVCAIQVPPYVPRIETGRSKRTFQRATKKTDSPYGEVEY
jgi:DNA replication protein DnaC